jgi:DNA polymerase-1
MYRHLTVGPQVVEQPKSFGLKHAVATFMPHEAGYENDVEFGTVNDVLLEYNKRDALFTLQLAQRFLDQMSFDTDTPRADQHTRSRQKCAMLMESKSIPLVAETYVHGLHTDLAALQALDKRLEDDHNLAFVKLKLDTPEVTPEMLSSPKQLSKLLYTTWGLRCSSVTAGGQQSTDKDALHELSLEDPRAAWVRDYREAANNRAKFVTSTLSSIDYNGDGCTRPHAKIYGTYTGRMTYFSKQGKGKAERPTGVALHQWKRDAAFRKTITPPPGYTLLEFDFAGQEFRWMAVEAKDPTMLQLCADGEDAHSYMGARVAGMRYEDLKAAVEDRLPGAKDKRQLGKVANLSLQYRTSPPTLMRVARTNYNLPMELHQAQAIHATYLTTYLQVSKYWDRQIYMGKKYGYVQTLAGRRVCLGPMNAEYADAKAFAWARDSTAINFPIQGVGADQKYLALAVLRNYLPKVDGRFYFELHDGLFIVVPDDKAEKAAHEVKHLLSNLPYKRAWGVDLPIQFPVDAKMGSSWGELKEVK